jgi:hypothetical protein
MNCDLGITARKDLARLAVKLLKNIDVSEQGFHEKAGP